MTTLRAPAHRNFDLDLILRVFIQFDAKSWLQRFQDSKSAKVILSFL